MKKLLFVITFLTVTSFPIMHAQDQFSLSERNNGLLDGVFIISAAAAAAHLLSAGLSGYGRRPAYINFSRNCLSCNTTNASALDISSDLAETVYSNDKGWSIAFAAVAAAAILTKTYLNYGKTNEDQKKKQV